MSTLQAAIVAAREKAKRLRDRTVENMGALTLTMGNGPAGGAGGSPSHHMMGGSGSVGGGPVNLDQLSAKVRAGGRG